MTPTPLSGAPIGCWLRASPRLPLPFRTCFVTGLPGRLAIVQQVREEDLSHVREAFTKLSIWAEVAPFFPDLPARMAACHLVVARSGASTVAELAAIGR